MGTKQLVVHEALDTTRWLSGSKSPSFTPTTKVASAPDAGAETITLGAPASRWEAALSRAVKNPVDSTTTSTPKSPQGRSAGLRSESTCRVLPPISSAPSTTATGSENRPITESYCKRWAMVSRLPKSLTATNSKSAPPWRAALKKFRPMRPNPLIPTRMLMRLRLT